MKLLDMLLLSLTLTAAAQKAPQELYWTMSWATSPEKPVPASVPPGSVFENTTIRQIVQLSTGEKCVRIRLSNLFDSGSMHVVSVDLADAVSAASSQIQPGSGS